MRKKNYAWLAPLFALALVAIPALLAKADPPEGQCHYVRVWHPLNGGGTTGEQGCIPWYCTNPSVVGMDRCYAHWGAPEVPNPCD